MLIPQWRYSSRAALLCALAISVLFPTRYSTRVSRSENVARVPGFEPGAYRLGGGCSIQLSYTRVTSTPILARLDHMSCEAFVGELLKRA